MGGAHRLTAFLLASSLAHAAMLVGMTGSPAIDVTSSGDATAISVRLVPAGSGGHEGTSATSVAEAVPRAADQPASEPTRTDDDPAGRTESSRDNEDQDSEANQRTAEPSDHTEERAQPEPTETPEQAQPMAAATRSAPAPSPHEALAAANDGGGTAPPEQQVAHAAEQPAAGGDRGDADRRQLAQRARSAVERELAEHFHYPRLARQRGWEGRVVLAVRIDGNGHIDNVAVQESSGRAILDKSAVESLRRIQRLPGLAERLGSTVLELTLPVRYRLEAG